MRGDRPSAGVWTITLRVEEPTEELRDVKTMLGQQCRQVETRYAPRNLRELVTDLVCVFVTQCFRLAVDLAFAAGSSGG